MARSFWLVKSEPGAYGWDRLMAEKRTLWTGVRNFSARNNLAAMKKGDRVLYYHSGAAKAVVGVAEVKAGPQPDPTAKAGEGWVAVELSPSRALTAPVTLAAIKADPKLREIELLRQSRLSVMPIPKAAFERILALGKASLR